MSDFSKSTHLKYLDLTARWPSNEFILIIVALVKSIDNNNKFITWPFSGQIKVLKMR